MRYAASSCDFERRLFFPAADDRNSGRGHALRFRSRAFQGGSLLLELLSPSSFHLFHDVLWQIQTIHGPSFLYCFGCGRMPSACMLGIGGERKIKATAKPFVPAGIVKLRENRVGRRNKP